MTGPEISDDGCFYKNPGTAWVPLPEYLVEAVQSRESWRTAIRDETIRHWRADLAEEIGELTPDSTGVDTGIAYLSVPHVVRYILHGEDPTPSKS